jgi:hypothetical protein
LQEQWEGKDKLARNREDHLKLHFSTETPKETDDPIQR